MSEKRESQAGPSEVGDAEGEAARAPGAGAGGRGHRARMPIQVEPHGLVSQARRFSADDPGQFAFELTYPLNGQTAGWRVTADNDAVVLLGVTEDGSLQRYPLPGPLTHDLFVVIGEDANVRTRGRNWNYHDDRARTFEWSLHELIGRVRQAPGGETRKTLVETLTRLARLRITASGGAGRAGGRRTRTTVTTGLFDRLEVTEEPGETRVALTLSRDLAQQIAEDFRLLETDRYWQIEGAPARRLYRLLDWACYTHDTQGTGTLRVPVHFLRDRIPIDRQKTAHIVQRLETIHEELVRVGFLLGMPTYEDSLAEDVRRFPTYPGKRAKLVSAVYRVAPKPAQVGKGEVPGQGRGGEAGGGMDPEKRALLASLGITPAVATGRSELHERVLEVQQLCHDRANVGLYTALCKALPEDAYRLVVSTIRADRPENPRAAFVRMAREQLALHRIPVPGEATNPRTLRDLLVDR